MSSHTVWNKYIIPALKREAQWLLPGHVISDLTWPLWPLVALSETCHTFSFLGCVGLKQDDESQCVIFVRPTPSEHSSLRRQVLSDGRVEGLDLSGLVFNTKSHIHPQGQSQLLTTLEPECSVLSALACL